MKHKKTIWKGTYTLQREYVPVWVYPNNRLKIALQVLFKGRITVRMLKSLFKKNRIKFLKGMYEEEK